VIISIRTINQTIFVLGTQWFFYNRSEVPFLIKRHSMEAYGALEVCSPMNS